MPDNSPSPLGRPVNLEARENKRVQILDGAQKCFVEQGFHKATMANIAREATVNVASIYQYFENKDAIVEALVEKISSQEIENLKDFDPEKYDYAGLKALVLPLYTSSAARDMAALRVEILSEAARNPRISKCVANSSAELIRVMATFVRRFQEAGTITGNLDTDSAAADLAYFHEGIQTHIPLAPDQREQLLEIHLRFIASRLGIQIPRKSK